jgi:hypothetical protein
MSNEIDQDLENARPFLLRFLRPLEASHAAIVYDRTMRVNVLAGQTVPAVCGGIDVKTLGETADD